jgi:hypothetical protein
MRLSPTQIGKVVDHPGMDGRVSVPWSARKSADSDRVIDPVFDATVDSIIMGSWVLFDGGRDLDLRLLLMMQTTFGTSQTWMLGKGKRGDREL